MIVSPVVLHRKSRHVRPTTCWQQIIYSTGMWALLISDVENKTRKNRIYPHMCRILRLLVKHPSNAQMSNTRCGGITAEASKAPSAISPSAFCSAFKSQYRAQLCPAQHGTARMLISSSNADSKKTPKREVGESFLARLPAGYSFLALSEICNSNPRGEAKCSEHIVSAQMWTCRWTRSHRRSLGKHNTALSAPPEKYRKSNQGVRGHTGSLRRLHRHGQSVKGNSCQRSSHLHYFRERSRRVLDLLQQQTPSVR